MSVAPGRATIWGVTAHDLLAADRFAAALGARLVEAETGRVVVEMDVAPHHRDGTGQVSVGALFSLADCALSLISNQEAAAVAVATHFTRSVETVEARVIRAEARPALPVRDRPATWAIIVQADGREVATFTGTTLRVG